MNKVILNCDYCGAQIERIPSWVKKHNFCSRQCLANYSSKSKNPEKYAELKNYAGMSENMKRLNEQLNPTRMTHTVRSKLRKARLAKGNNGKTYEKVYGRPTHRVVAEMKIGRALRPGEVVHHIDGNKRNNSIENLMVFPSQAEHAKWHKEHDKEVMPDDIQTT